VVAINTLWGLWLIGGGLLLIAALVLIYDDGLTNDRFLRRDNVAGMVVTAVFGLMAGAAFLAAFTDVGEPVFAVVVTSLLMFGSFWGCEMAAVRTVRLIRGSAEENWLEYPEQWTLFEALRFVVTALLNYRWGAVFVILLTSLGGGFFAFQLPNAWSRDYAGVIRFGSALDKTEYMYNGVAGWVLVSIVGGTILVIVVELLRYGWVGVLAAVLVVAVSMLVGYAVWRWSDLPGLQNSVPRLLPSDVAGSLVCER
jgi:hypothetical protein